MHFSLYELSTRKNIQDILYNEIEKILPAIGKGQFGTVYKGIYQGKLVAIKKIKLKENIFYDDEETQIALNEITNEIKTLKYVINSRIPLFYGLWKNQGKFNLIIEFCPGKNLKDAYPSLNFNQKLSVCLQLSETLQSIHSFNLIHRDIKPSNIMIDDNYSIKIIDFGLSKIAKRTSTFTGCSSGTTRYIAPECFDLNLEYKEGESYFKINAKIDIWSTGCLISEIFSGKIPWNNVQNEMSLMKKLIDKNPFPIPEEIQIDEIRDIIINCVKIKPNDRISAKDLTNLIKEKINNFNQE
jgi:serine/threonine protein kinase